MSFVNDTKPTTSWINDSTSLKDSFLLKEDSFYLLLEDGSKIVLVYGTNWTNGVLPTTSYTNDALPA